MEILVAVVTVAAVSDLSLRLWVRMPAWAQEFFLALQRTPLGF